MQIAIDEPITATIATDFFLDKPNFVCTASTGVSNRFTNEVKPANVTARKKIIITRFPPGICENTLGKKMNISPGPPLVNS